MTDSDDQKDEPYFVCLICREIGKPYTISCNREEHSDAVVVGFRPPQRPVKELRREPMFLRGDTSIEFTYNEDILQLRVIESQLMCRVLVDDDDPPWCAWQPAKDVEEQVLGKFAKMFYGMLISDDMNTALGSFRP